MNAYGAAAVIGTAWALAAVPITRLITTYRRAVRADRLKHGRQP